MLSTPTGRSAKTTTKHASKVDPLTKDEYDSLKQSIAEHGQWVPIDVNENDDVLDGHHRLRICEELGLEPVFNVREFDSEIEEELFVRQINRIRRQLTTFQKIELVLKEEPLRRELAKMNMVLGGKLKTAFTNVGKPSILHTQESLAKDANTSKGSLDKVKQIIGSKLFQEDTDFRKDCRSGKASINFAYQAVRKSQFDKPPAIDEAEAWGKALEGVTDDLERFARFGKKKYHNLVPMTYNVWNFMEVDLRLGLDHPGQIPGQIAMNVLYFYTKLRDLVVDPMAGGGSTIDACKVMGRRCLAYDIRPVRPDIGEWNIYREQALLSPEVRATTATTSPPDLIFLDPPYGFIMRSKYPENSLSSLSTEDFLKAMEVIASVCYDSLKGGGHVALVMQGILDEKNEYFLDLPFRCASMFERAGFKQKQRISVPMSTQTKGPLDVARFQKKKELLDINRDLLIFVKP